MDYDVCDDYMFIGSSTCNVIKGDVVIDDLHRYHKIMADIYLNRIIGVLRLQRVDATHFTLPYLHEVSEFICENSTIEKLYLGTDQPYMIHTRNCSNLKLEPYQQRFHMHLENGNFDSASIQQMYHEYDLIPFIIFMIFFVAMIIVNCSIMLIENNKLKRNEDKLIANLTDMRESILTTQLLVQTPQDKFVALDKPLFGAKTGENRIRRVMIAKKCEKTAKEPSYVPNEKTPAEDTAKECTIKENVKEDPKKK